jgi:hypothetical protein
MRTFLAVLSLILFPCLSSAQSNSGAQAAQAAEQAAQAAQQAAQQSQQASMQAMHDASEANRQASEASQRAMQDAQAANTEPCCIYWTAPPKFSVKPGKYSGPTTVRITDATRGAVIYYSTDGWTPTTNSPRYRGPILIDSTTTLQAIAIAPYSVRSIVTSAKYTIAGAAASSSAGGSFQEAMNGPANVTPVYLVFDAEVTSKTATVGDKIPLVLAEDLIVGSTLVKKGSLATVTITQVDRTGMAGAPGTLSFEADELQTESGPIPLQGGATREGQAKVPNAAFLVPGVGEYMLLRHGTDAVIAKGTPFIAYLGAQPSTAAK